MADIVLLNNVDHADLRVAQGYGAAFGDAVNQTLVFPTEFEALQREYPILFRQGEDGGLQAVVLLGLDRDENLHLDGAEWRARYIPALHRRGPFSIGLKGEKREPQINVDIAHPRVTVGDGEPVFRRHGGPTAYLETVQDALSTVYAGIESMGPMIKVFAELGLIEPVAIDITVGEGRRYNLEGYLAIGRERLASLDGPALERLNRDGWLSLAFHALASLANIERLIELKNRKEGVA